MFTQVSLLLHKKPRLALGRPMGKPDRWWYVGCQEVAAGRG